MPRFNITVNANVLSKIRKDVDDKIRLAHAAIKQQFIAEATGFADKWAQSAKNKLKTPMNYIQNIREDMGESDSMMVYTISNYYQKNGVPLVLLLENGYDPFDMKSSLFHSKNVKVSKKGHLYRIIPFTSHNPYKEGAMVTPPHITEQMHEAFQRMSKQGIVTGKHIIMTPTNLARAGYGETDIKELLGEKKTQSRNLNLKSVKLEREVKFRKSGYPMAKIVRLEHDRKKVFPVNYTWKNQKFDRMQTRRMKTGKVYRNYTTFRVMSSAPNQSSAYIHPGLRPLNIFSSVYNIEKDAIGKRMQEFMDTYIREITGN